MLKNSIITLSSFIFLLLPWYYMDPGQLQPVDAPIISLLMIFFIMGFSFFTKVLKYAKIYKIFLYFSIYIIISLLLNYILGTEDATLNLLAQNIYSIFLVTAFLLLFVYLDEIKENKFYNLILIFLLIDLVFPFVKWMTIKSIGVRESLTFTNANQLGFYALINLSVLFYISLLSREKKIKLNKVYAIIILNINFLFLFVATSRAAYVAIILYVISCFIIFPLRVRGYTKWIFWTLGLALAFFLILVIGQKLLGYMQYYRADVKNQTSISIVNEIYFRAIKGADANLVSPWTFLFGSGVYTTAGRKGLEFHNNFVAIFFQVGFIGLIFYFYMNIVILKELFKKGAFYLIPYFCYLYYSLFHYSYRVRINWLFLSLIIFIFIIEQKNIRHPSRAG